MYKSIFSLLFSLILTLLINFSTAYAVRCTSDAECAPPAYPPGYFCSADPTDSTLPKYCQENKFKGNFGTIKAPDALQGLLKDPTGAAGISSLLSNIITLFYSIAAVVLIFMLLWGAFEWLTSGGDKEQLATARNRIISAFIGILLFAVTFAIIQVLGTFTGFKFFVGQK